MAFPKQIQHLADMLSSLPNVGPKLSNRLALYLSVNAKELAKNLSLSLEEVIKNIRTCNLCGNVTDKEICMICSDNNRNQSIILCLEDALDLNNIESAGNYSGLYHVLGGLISPINGIGPEEIKIDLLLRRIQNNKVEEIILGLNPNLEGDSTSLYIKDLIEKDNHEIKITRLAKGIPAGGDIEFVSSQTIIDSMKSRTKF